MKINKENAINLLVVDMGAGRYYQESGGGHERFNLDRNRIDGKYYGYCPPDNKIDIVQRFGAKTRDEFVEGVLVVYVSKKNNSNDRETIAFCPSAKVYGRPQSGRGLNREVLDKETGQTISATYSIISDELFEIDKGRLTIINDDKTIPILGNTDRETSNRFRAQRFYGKTYPQLSKRITEYIEVQLIRGEMLDDDFEEQKEIQEVCPIDSKEIQDSANLPLSTILDSGRETIKKDIRFSKAALIQTNYKCQVDENHETFLTKIGNPYMEGHHLIPCTLTNASNFMEKYSKNIDCVENIICICPTCHRAVHFGDENVRTGILRKLYDKQEPKLKSAGIPISEEELLELYKK